MIIQKCSIKIYSQQSFVAHLFVHIDASLLPSLHLLYLRRQTQFSCRHQLNSLFTGNHRLSVAKRAGLNAAAQGRFSDQSLNGGDDFQEGGLNIHAETEQVGQGHLRQKARQSPQHPRRKCAAPL